MNIYRSHLPPSAPQPIRLTTEVYLDMDRVLAGRFEKTELLDGVIYEMPMDGPLTRKWNSVLTKWIIQSAPDDVVLVNHQTLPLGDYWAPSPDHYLFPASVADTDLLGPDILIVIEVSDTTLEYDLREKADAYAQNGVAEYWVIDPNEKKIYAHRRQESGKYGKPIVYSQFETAAAVRIPSLKLRLADLPRIN